MEHPEGPSRAYQNTSPWREVLVEPAALLAPTPRLPSRSASHAPSPGEAVFSRAPTEPWRG